MVTTYQNLESDIKKTDWKFASENIDDDLHTDILFMETSIRLLRKIIDCSYSQGVLLYNGHTGRFYFPKKEAQEINDILINRLKKDIHFGDLINKNIVKKSIELERVWSDYSDFRSFSSIPIDKLHQLYNQQLKRHYELYEYGWIPEILQDGDYGIDNWIVSIAQKYDLDFSRKDIFALLPENALHTVYLKQDIALLKIVRQILMEPDMREIFLLPLKYIRTEAPHRLNKQIRQLVDKYAYLGYHGYDDRRPYDFNYYLGKIKFYIENEAELLALEKRTHSTPHRSDLWGKLTGEEKHLCSIYNNWGVTKSRRRLAQLRNFYFLDMLIEELAFLKKIPEDYVRFMTPSEIQELFTNDKLPVDIERRSQSCLYYINHEDYYICTDAKGDVIEDKCKSISPILFGNIACPGFQVGKAYLIERKSDIFSKSIEKGDILVAKEADPDIFVVFDKLKAIVTDQGGITCHVASLAREYGIPCVVGTRFATEVINNGDIIEVDAYSGVIKKQK